MRLILSRFLLIIVLLLPTQSAAAQDQPAGGPVYVVQPGDTYYTIAIKFGTTIADLETANPGVDPNFLTIGQEIVIPGLEGVRGRLETEIIPLGETLRTLSIRNQVLPDQVVKLNRVTSPAEVYAGASLIIPQVEDARQPQPRYLISSGQSIFQVAVENNLNPWLLTEINQQDNTWGTLPGEVVFDQASDQTEPVNLVSPVVKEIIVDPLPVLQGETTVIKVTTTQPVDFTGSLAGHDLQFFPHGDNTYVALQGVHVMANPGIYSFSLAGKLQDGSQFSFEQMLVLEALGYIQEKIEGVDPSTIDPAVTKPEEDQIYAVIAPASPEKMWDGIFLSPGYDPNWITSSFGNRRSYNGGPYTYFHAGVDYGGGTGLPIKAPAPGVVVFAGPLTVRGNATIIDHGWGVYSGFWHQSEIDVQVGDRVNTGEVIGLVGGTGRITGPHLHWEIWVNGVQIQPLTWLERAYP